MTQTASLFYLNHSLPTVTQWMTVVSTNVCFPFKSNNDLSWQAVPPSCSHVRMSPLKPFSFCPHPSFELYPRGCTHPLSSHRCATTFLPDQFLTQMSTDEADEIWQQLQTERRQERVARLSSPLVRGSGNAGGLLVGGARAENERASRRSTKILPPYAAEERQRSWNNRAFEVSTSNCWRDERRERANHHRGRFFLETFDLKMNRWNKKCTHAQSSQSTLRGCFWHSLSPKQRRIRLWRFISFPLERAFFMSFSFVSVECV